MPDDGIAESGLDNHLRNLILTDQTPQNEAAQHLTRTREDLAEPSGFSFDWSRGASSENPFQFRPDSHWVNRPSKNCKQRPNNVQRRQMSSNLPDSLESRWTPDPHFQPSSQQNMSSPPSQSRWDMSRACARGEQRPFRYPPKSNTQSTAWYNPAASSLPQLAETQTNASDHLHLRSGPSAIHHTGHYLPTASVRHERGQPANTHETGNETALLEKLCHEVVKTSEIDGREIAQKEIFRQKVEVICQQVITGHERQNDILSDFPTASVQLKCFGSMSSGFATKSSDMDLGLFSPLSKKQPDSAGSPIPRLIEKAFLDAGYGARLLTRTRVPIIKLCEAPTEDLRRALLAEREIWESGGDVAGGPDDQSQDLNNQLDAINDAKEAEFVVESHISTASQPEVDEAHNRVGRIELKQNPNSSLKSYYYLAKKVLRRAGGRDITASNYYNFSRSDWAILNRVCQAFVQGLHNDLLRQQLESRSSLSFKESGTVSFNRSLFGVFTQVEGEKLLLDWEQFLAKGVFHEPTGRINLAISSWLQVQNQFTCGHDPLRYNKELHAAFHRIKNLPEIQLMQLAQRPEETPTEYYYRANGLVGKCLGSDLDESKRPAQSFVLAYISGIRDESVRSTMAYSKYNIPFEQLGQKHKCLQLARDLERAVDHQLYDQHLQGEINEYIRLLRMPLIKVQISRNQSAFRIPVTAQNLSMLCRIRQLPDPRKLAINQSPNRSRDPLEFPNSGIGVQCDINFSAHLALQNTRLLRCYSLTDPRVRPMVIFVKKWANVRGINSGYRGTLSSYGFVLMVLHFLVNVAKPFVCPNLQHLSSTSETDKSTTDQDDAKLSGYNVQFWQNEPEISRLAASHQLTFNTETIGQLLRGFFEYYAQSGLMSNGLGNGFDWGRDVLSLRTHGGLLTKREKGWVAARTVVERDNATWSQDSAQSGKPIHVKQVTHRYLFAIEDPFELDHNVARTVTHNGIVAIRDEFRRAWRLIQISSRGWNEDVMSDVTKTKEEPKSSFEQLIQEIHGPEQFWYST